MSVVFDAVGGFLNRNRRKFYWLGGTVGSGYLLFKYAQWKWTEFQQRREIEQTAKSNVKRRFEQNLQDCTFAVGSLLPTLGENLFNELNVELLTAQLQQTRQAKTEGGEGGEDQPGAPVTQPRKTKLEIWEELKLLSFTRTISSVYLVTLLIVFTHLQLSLLGRFFYLDSVVAFSQTDREQQVRGTVGGRKGVSDETERKYLTFSWYVLNVGWKQCVAQVQRAVQEVVGSISLKEVTTYDALIEIIGKVREKVEDENGENSNMTAFLLPEEGKEEDVLRAGGVETDGFVVDKELKDLLNETRDFLDSSDFRKVLKSCFDEAFDLLFKQLRPTFFAEQESRQRSHIAEVQEGEDIQDNAENKGKAMPLAGVIPVISRLVHHVVNGVPNIFLEILSTQPELKALSVVMYTGWEDHVL
ncbi:uncharacterized protein SPPG_09176 [Spizellomyces punctatus DAOM BR117]|uniref:Peroxin-3 n=1 Tax=Spizellomyces punctatus (strain DAOM BR117) TaxID=645134 RepID=A0A0L0HJ06_SPIPD|nr:uncharacterized protein SPPG_09176 [Spizellomyces punctatus DAOM BR117]KND01018.1 hypothetical protein SPPG_09176 [Spizellomyces punctatus DAOM BR117]|eukprot:XP_016609057.1 hypothetical protein SPPG_09176 [Spizellomyces punctatus DAOM BR117]